MNRRYITFLQTLRFMKKSNVSAAIESDSQIIESTNPVCRICRSDSIEDLIECPCGCKGSIVNIIVSISYLICSMILFCFCRALSIGNALNNGTFSVIVSFAKFAMKNKLCPPIEEFGVGSRLCTIVGDTFSSLLSKHLDYYPSLFSLF